MMSATSSNNRRRTDSGSLNLFLWTLRKNMLITGIASVLALLICPGSLLPEYLNDTTGRGIDPLYQSNFYDMSGVFSVANILLTFLAAGLILMLTAINYRYMHSKKSTDVFHALPITRTSLLLSRYLATAVLVLIPVLISYGATALVLLLTPYYGVSAEFFLASVFVLTVFVLICTAFSILIAVSAGNTFDMFVALLVVNIGWPIVWLVITTMCRDNLFGFPDYSDSEWLLALSPFGKMFRMPIGAANKPYGFYGASAEVIPLFPGLFWWIGAGIATLAAAILLYRRRKSETAGSSYSFAYLPAVMQVMVVVVSGFLFGMLFSSGDSRSLTFYLFFCIGALLGGVIIGAIMSRGFKKVLRDVVITAVVSGVFLSYSLIVQTGAFGYETRVPEPGSVAKVTFANRDYSKSAMYSGSYEVALDLSSPADVEAVCGLHKEIVDKAAEQKLSPGAYVTSPLVTNQEGASTSLTFTYHMKHGGSMKRTYSVSPATFFSRLSPIIYSDEYLRASESVFRYEDYSHYVYAEMQYQYAGNSNTYSANVGNEVVSELISAYKKDLAGLKSLTKPPRQQYVLSLMRLAPGAVYNQDHSDVITLHVMEGFENTLAVLEEHGYDRVLKASTGKTYTAAEYIMIPSEEFESLRDYGGATFTELLNYLYDHQIPVHRVSRDALIKSASPSTVFDSQQTALQSASGNIVFSPEDPNFYTSYYYDYNTKPVPLSAEELEEHLALLEKFGVR